MQDDKHGSRLNPVAKNLSELPVADRGQRARWCWELGIVLALTVGQSAVYSVLSFVRSLLRSLRENQAISSQQTRLNPSRDDEAIWDAINQLLPIAFELALVALMIYLLWEPGRSALRRIGLDFMRWPSDVGRGVLLLATIGIPGLVLYAAGRAGGFTLAVVASPLDAAWWTVPLLVLSAVRAGLIEEVFLAYAFDRLRRVGWSWWTIILGAAALRGAYHVYQGVGSMLGNFAMGVLLGWCYRRWGRVMPLVIAHTLLDVIAFVGYPLATAAFPTLFAPPS